MERLRTAGAYAGIALLVAVWVAFALFVRWQTL
jgi:hypothetical protein